MNSYESSGKICVVERPEYTIYFEYVAELLILHGDVHVPYTATICRRIQADIATLNRLMCRTPLRAVHYDSQGPKHLKWLRSQGFTFERLEVDASGEICELHRYGQPIRQD